RRGRRSRSCSPPRAMPESSRPRSVGRRAPRLARRRARRIVAHDPVLTRWKAGEDALAVDYAKLGRTGLDVSRICLGCMSYGDAKRGGHQWVLDEDTARPYFKQALDAGINFFDTANVYSVGSSEEFLG